MATSVALGYYAICFPNPIGTSGGAKVVSTINTGFNLNSALLPQSCLGFSLTILTGTLSALPESRALAAAVSATA